MGHYGEIEMRTVFGPKHARRNELVGEWPERALFGGALVRNFDPDVATFDGQVIRIRVDNGSAEYTVDRYDEAMDWYETSLTAGETADVR